MMRMVAPDEGISDRLLASTDVLAQQLWTLQDH